MGKGKLFCGALLVLLGHDVGFFSVCNWSLLSSFCSWLLFSQITLLHRVLSIACLALFCRWFEDLLVVGFVVYVGKSLHPVCSVSAFRSIELPHQLSIGVRCFYLASHFEVFSGLLPAMGDNLLHKGELPGENRCLLLQLLCLFNCLCKLRINSGWLIVWGLLAGLAVFLGVDRLWECDLVLCCQWSGNFLLVTGCLQVYVLRNYQRLHF